MADGKQRATPMRFASRLRQIAPAIILLTCLSSALANNPIPTVVGPVVPQAVVPGSGAFTLKVYGANFVSGAVVNWNRSPRSTTFISARELRAQILASDVATATAGYITVTNPPPGGGVSSASYAIVEVHRPTATIVAKQPIAYLKGGGNLYLPLADFNNDGILDFAAQRTIKEMDVRLGNGDGTFRFGSVATYNSYSQSAIATGDFNNDGNEDLVFGADWQGPPTQLQVNLGNGEGKFRFASRFANFPELWPLDIAVGDFNQDGNLDLAVVAGDEDEAVSIFLGNGNGTFGKPRSYPISLFPNSVVTGDFNGDGKLDLVVGNGYDLEVLFGNGNGTFQKARKVASFRSTIFQLLVSDFDGDGTLDLAVAERDQTNGKLWIILGNGDGTFKKPVALTIKGGGNFGFSFTAGDFNSDGKTDLLVNYGINDNQTETDLYLGNGDGTFQEKKIVNLPGAPNYNAELGIVPADFNSDGLLDFIFQQPGDIAVFLQK
ncbi:MAG: VCBS repeat-containing protein [Terriglobales bacterium]|jgi:hypothetical protein